jgi:hypothetical protein
MRRPAFPKRFITRLALSLVVSGGLAVALAGSPAVASTPDIETFPISETGVDPGASAVCGFTVSFALSGTGSFQVVFNPAGDPTRVLVHENVSGTFSANGRVVSQAAHTATFYDLAEGTQTEVGLVDRIFGISGTLQMEVGRLVFDANGDLIFEAGPHPALHDDFTALCAALRP